MKKLICMFLMVAMLAAVVPAVYASEKTALEVGDRIIIGTYQGEPVEYKVMGERDVDGDGVDELFLASSQIISFKGYNSGKTANYGLSWKEDIFGRQPSLRVWLNSNAEVVSYGTETDGETEVVPTYSDQVGFMAGMTDFEQSKIVSVTHNTTVADFHDKEHKSLPIDGGSGHFATWAQNFPQAYTNNVAKTPYEDAAFVTTTDKVFIPSIKDIYDFFGGNVDNATATANMNVGATAIAQAEVAEGSEALYQKSNTLLRDMYFEDAGGLGSSTPYRWNGQRAVCNSGMRATSVGGVRPCMYIEADVEIEETEEGSGIYQMKLPIRASISVEQNGSEIVEVEEGEIKVTGTAKTSVEADIIAAVFRNENGTDIMEDYVRSSDLDSIDLTLNASGTGNRYVGVFFMDADNKCITSAKYAGGTPSVLWSDEEEVTEISATATVEGKTVMVEGVLPDDGSYNLGVVVKKRDTDAVAYVNQFNTEDGRGFGFSIKVESLFGATEETAAEGWYDIILSTDNESKVIRAGIAGPGIWTGVLEKINEGDADFVESVFLNEEGYELEYNSLTDKGFYLDEYSENADVLVEAVENLISNKPAKGYTAENVAEAFNTYITCAYFDFADGEEKFLIIENDKYDEVLGVNDIKDSKSYIKAKTVEDAEGIFEDVTSENVSTKIFENIILMIIKNAENSTEIRTVIEDYAEKIGLEFKTGYKKLSGTTLKKLYDVYFDKTVNDLDDVIDIFEDTYKELTATKPSSGGGGSGGGGALGVKRPSIPANAENKDEDEETAKPDENEKTILKDENKLTWAKEAVLYLVEKGIVSGNENGEFCPEDNISREQFAKIAVLAFGVTAEGNVKFNDVNQADWYADYVNTLASAGIINGVGDGSFGIGKNITRQDMAVIVYRILKNEGKIEKSDEMGFADGEKIADYAYEAVCSLGAAGFVNGYDDNTFRGENSITRQEAAQIIYNIIGGAK